MFPLTKEHLTEDDIKVIKHLRSIDRLFKKGNLSISQLFVDNDILMVTKIVDDHEYEVESFNDITCDGGDPDRYGQWGLHDAYELESLYEEQE